MFFRGEITFFLKKPKFDKNFQDFSFPELLGSIFSHITVKNLFRESKYATQKYEINVFLKNQIPKIFEILNFEKFDLKKIYKVFTIFKISKMKSALKTESKTVFGARSILLQLFKSLS